jgi:hypothetical protein
MTHTARFVSYVSISLTAATCLVACLVPGDEDATGASGSDLAVTSCTDVSGTDPARSLMVTDEAVLAQFSFARVMNQIRATSNTAPVSSLAVWKAWMATFGSSSAPGDCNDPNIDPNKYGMQCPRTHELELSTINPFAASPTVTFLPVAVVNRFDLAPSNGANCGEYRVVYAMSSTVATPSGRGFIIFEAALPNPNPTQGISACLPVAQFWQALSQDASATSRAAKLARFYFSGTAVAGFSPVVQAAHYGLATNGGAPTAGQIRTNFFVDFAEWHLREFKTHRQCTDVNDEATCKLALAQQPVKANPANEVFDGTSAHAPAFQSAFVAQVPRLAVLGDPAKISMATSSVFNEWESVSQRTDVVYRTHANATIKADIQTKLTQMGSTLTVANILDRATTQTCAGCHELSNGVSLGGGETWPSSLGFVQIDESSNLSPALTRVFLPRRKVVLEAFINARCGASANAAAPTSAATEETTLGGSPVSAAN